jgi:hypothetical protein
MADQTQKNDGSQPGVMGDWTEEQDLGQPGHPEDRIKKDEVDAAFGAEREGAGRGRPSHTGGRPTEVESEQDMPPSTPPG